MPPSQIVLWEYCPRCLGLRGGDADFARGRFEATLPTKCTNRAECRHELALLVGAGDAVERGIHGGQLL